MDAIAWITALYVGVWIGVYSDDLKKEFTPKPKVEQTQQTEEKK
jgi:hypothetical protein